MVMGAWEHLQTECEFLGFLGWGGASRCLLVFTVSDVPITPQGGPSLPKKNLQIGAVSTHAFAVCSFWTKGITNSMQGSSSSRSLHMDTDVCLEAWARWCSETQLWFVWFRRAALCWAVFSGSSLHVCRLLLCRQKSLINCHYKM